MPWQKLGACAVYGGAVVAALLAPAASSTDAQLNTYFDQNYPSSDIDVFLCGSAQLPERLSALFAHFRTVSGDKCLYMADSRKVNSVFAKALPIKNKYKKNKAALALSNC